MYGAHGANRLASNSLLEGLVFGTRIAESIVKNIGEQEEPVENNEKIFLADPAIKMPLQLAMSKGAGVLRSEKSLKDTLAILEQLGKHQSSAPRIESWEVSNLYQLAVAIVNAAIARQETRGSHWRSDYPEPSDKWLKHIIQSIDLNGNWSSREESVQ
jgi:L-aspartate oxidase